jgi:hypothetical protein
MYNIYIYIFIYIYIYNMYKGYSCLLQTIVESKENEASRCARKYVAQRPYWFLFHIEVRESPLEVVIWSSVNQPVKRTRRLFVPWCLWNKIIVEKIFFAWCEHLPTDCSIGLWCVIDNWVWGEFQHFLSVWRDGLFARDSSRPVGMRWNIPTNFKWLWGAQVFLSGLDTKCKLHFSNLLFPNWIFKQPWCM